MKIRLLAAALVTVGMVFLGQVVTADGPMNAGGAAPVVTSKVPAKTLSTFHCLSVYWSPEGGALEKKVLVKFREAGGVDKTWHEGLSMRYNPVKTPECKGDYRGSIVNLKPNTSYDIALTLEGTDTTTAVQAATWNENFPIASTVKCKSGDSTITINKSGTPEGYILYDGAGCTIDSNNKVDMGIDVNADYIIIRGFTIKNVKANCINIAKGHHIVIEDCDLSKWGSEDSDHIGYGIEMNAGVYSKNHDLHAVVIQRCKIHNPTWNTNSWAEDHYKGRESKHPAGPQTIVFWETQGNNVIRYNECWSDKDHYYDDVMGGAFNAGFRGWPGADSDIYCNYIANCWDDGIEAEGGGQNVRIWDNYIENTMMTIADAAVSIGPLYIWQNIGGRSYSPPGSKYGMTHGNFMKMGYADSAKWMTGHMYVFNNTIFQIHDDAAMGLGGDSKMITHCVSRNNILQARSTDTHSISTDKKGSFDDDFDYDLLSGRYPDGSEKHGIKGVPKYVADAGFSFDTKTGDFKLADGSPGQHQAVVIPNFCEGVKGVAPDMGAQQSGTPPMVFGVKAVFIPQGPAAVAPAMK